MFSGSFRVMAGLPLLCCAFNIQNQGFAENDCLAPMMICVRSSFDSGALCPSGRNALRISSLSKREPSKRLMRPLSFVLIYTIVSLFYLVTAQIDPWARLFSGFPLRQTRNPSDASLPDGHSAPLSKLERTQIIIGARQSFSANP